MSSKVCSKCNTDLPISEYYTIKKTGYVYPYCRKCHYSKMTKNTSKKWRETYPEKWKKASLKAVKAAHKRDTEAVYLLVTTKGLYVGATDKLKHRLAQHKGRKSLGNVAYYGAKVLFHYVLAYEKDKRKRLDIEREWIERLQPSLNKMHTKR